VRWFHSDSLRHFLHSDARWEDWDLVHLDELLLLPFLPPELPLPLVVHHHKLDLDHAEALGEKASICSRWRQLERAACTRTQHHVVCGREDGQRLAERHEHIRVHVIPCGADANKFRPDERQPVEGRVLFLGSLDYEPNLRALEEFVPHFHAARARDARLHLQIVGARPDARVLKLVGDGIALEADVPDVRPFLQAAAALVAPLEIGGGSRVKICEALAAGCPVLASPCAVEGLELVAGKHLTVVSHPTEWPGALVELVEAPSKARASALEGRKRIRSHHHWPDLASRLAAAWRSCLQKPTENPAPL
jgi:glycosyltransferase involved in cell wall biosynthesis